MQLFIQTSSNALILASIYILVGLGFAFLFNMLGIFNVAHGAIYMAAGYLGYVLIGSVGINPWLGFALVILIIGAFGIFMERFCFRPFLGDFFSQIMIGVAITGILTTTVNVGIGSHAFIIPSFIQGYLKMGPYSIAWDRVLTFAIGFIILGLIVVFANRTRWGQQMRAITQNKEAAALQGINIYHIAAIVSALGCALAAVAGIMVGSMYTLDPFMGQNILTKILILVILAGVGNLSGIFIVGLILGVLYSVLPMYLIGSSSDAVAFALVCVILLFRPKGFFGYEA
jgi:branched-chain amino acid transport system permease protein